MIMIENSDDMYDLSDSEKYDDSLPWDMLADNEDDDIEEATPPNYEANEKADIKQLAKDALKSAKHLNYDSPYPPQAERNFDAIIDQIFLGG